MLNRIAEIKYKILELARAEVKDDETLKKLVDQLEYETSRANYSSNNHDESLQKYGDPACLGLAAFALTSTLGQMLNFQMISVGPVLILGLVFGGVVQFIAGVMDFIGGNGFGLAAFGTYGAFWICNVLILGLRTYTRVEISETDVGSFMFVFLLFTLILLAGAVGRTLVFSLIFSTLSAGFAFITAHHWWPAIPGLHMAGTIMFCIATALAYYLLAVHVLEDTYKRKVLPVGPPLTRLFGANRGFQVVSSYKANGEALMVTIEKNGA